MSSTALRCFLALGISISLAAACGDDDGDVFGNGGSAGSGGDAGSAGTGGGGAGGSGTGGSGMGGGAGMGMGGTMAGEGGSGGDGGTGGGDGGTGGGDGGTGGVDQPDAGDSGAPDATADAAPVDPGDLCPDFAAAALTIDPQQDQQIAIARVLFNPGNVANVILRNVSATPFALSSNVHLCADPAACESIVDDLTCNESILADGSLAATEELNCILADVSPDEGELALLNGDVATETVFAFAYIQWDESVPPNFGSPVASTDGGADTLESIAAESGPDNGKVWAAGQTIAMGVNEDTIVLEGNTATAEDFSTCTRD